MNTLFSALEQFDIFYLYGHLVGGINNVTCSLLMLTALLYVGTSIDVEKTRSIVLLSAVFAVSEFVRQLLKENVRSQKNVYFYYTITLFTFIIWCNLLGLIPYALTVTSYLAITMFLSSMSFFGNLFIGLRTHSFGFFAFFVPAGAPASLMWMLVAIEVISYFSRLFSLAIRLFANMMAGHALLKILSGFVFLFLQMNESCFFVAAFVVNLVVLAVTVLEVLIALLQAYVFVVLSTIYTNEAINLH